MALIRPRTCRLTFAAPFSLKNMTRSAAKGTVTCGLAQDEHDERKLVSPRWLRDRLEEVSVIDIRGQVKKLDRIYDADGVKYYQQRVRRLDERYR
mmetsp:Transcript_5453/g.23164  ORF Transcript_5453/g.23164 Transcript_5453/m.23164 type:complete len:95 (+) Transcript_5453:1577-1861(+)